MFFLLRNTMYRESNTYVWKKSLCMTVGSTPVARVHASTYMWGWRRSPWTPWRLVQLRCHPGPRTLTLVHAIAYPHIITYHQIICIHAMVWKGSKETCSMCHKIVPGMVHSGMNVTTEKWSTTYPCTKHTRLQCHRCDTSWLCPEHSVEECKDCLIDSCPGLSTSSSSTDPVKSMPIQAGYSAILPIAQTIVYAVIGKKARQPLPVLAHPNQNCLYIGGLM